MDDVGALDEAIALGAEAVLHGPASGPDRAMYLSEQARSLELRCHARKNGTDLESANQAGR